MTYTGAHVKISPVAVCPICKQLDRLKKNGLCSECAKKQGDSRYTLSKTKGSK